MYQFIEILCTCNYKSPLPLHSQNKCNLKCFTTEKKNEKKNDCPF